MTDIALGSSGLVQVVGKEGLITRGHIPTGVDVTAGAGVIIDPTTGKWALARGTTAPLARLYGLALRAQKAGYGLTVMRFGILDGFDLSALDYDDPVYLSDTAGGVLADAAGTVEVIVGRVIPGTSTLLGTAYDKLLEVNLLGVA
jgi:hypothetical protein